MKNIKVSFVILHYQTIQFTNDCVQNIRENFKNSNYFIVIVDNASPNHSGELLQKEYFHSEDVKVILNEKNLGYANGNNIGFYFAKNTLKSEFIVVLNNDVRFISKNIVDILEKIENDSNDIGVVGPLILSGDFKYNSNPMRDHKLSLNEINAFLKDAKKNLKLLKSPFSNLYQSYIKLRKSFSMFLNNKNMYNNHLAKDYYLQDHKDIILHGCCLFFMPSFIKQNDGFDNRTFMYGEEDLLYNKCKKNELELLFTPQIKVFHYEAASTEYDRNNVEKNIFYYSNFIKSFEIIKRDSIDELSSSN